MAPDLCDSTSNAVCVAEVNDRLAEREVNPFAPSMMMSSLLERLPRHARHWKNYLKDVTESRNKRFRRMENESIDDFLKRFPI